MLSDEGKTFEDDGSTMSFQARIFDAYRQSQTKKTDMKTTIRKRLVKVENVSQLLRWLDLAYKTETSFDDEDQDLRCEVILEMLR